jgi:hypothetical protein
MPRSVHVGFVVDKVALGQVSLRVLWFSPLNINLSQLSVLTYHLEDEQKVLGDRSFEILSHPIYINNMNNKSSVSSG